MARWTIDQVLATAPDDASRKNARGLTNPRLWTELGGNESLVWGKCQGSGKVPYQVTVDLHGPAYRCTCPSRKFPCKHSLALLLLWAANDGSVTDAQQPAAFADEWQSDRQAKQEARSARTAAQAERAEATDPEERARREARRAATMSDGIEEFDRWLRDAVRNGLAAVHQQPYSYWDDTAARLVDAQLPALAERVRELAGVIRTRPDWLDVVLATMARWSTLVAAWRVRDELDPPAVAELRRLLGWPNSEPPVTTTGRWVVMGSRSAANDRFSSLRTWVLDSSGDYGVVLDFAARSAAPPLAHLPGTELEGTVTVAGGLAPRRLNLDQVVTVGEHARLPGGGPVGAALEDLARHRAANPWAEAVPVLLSSVRFVCDRGRWHLVDVAGDGIEVWSAWQPWNALALLGDQPCQVFGEIEDRRLVPLAASSDEVAVIGL